MDYLEPDIAVQVDVTNPGQFFACCGLLELADRLCSGAEGWFEDDRFCVVIHSTEPHATDRIYEALVTLETTTESRPSVGQKEQPVLLGPPVNILLDWWLQENGQSNLFKTWAANANSRQMFRKWQKPLSKAGKNLQGNPIDMNQLFHWTDRIQGSYGFDSDLGWDALAVGFSLNEHGQYKKLPTRPAVELLGAIGLQRFFPELNTKERTVMYATWRVPLAAAIARIASVEKLPVSTKEKLQTRFVFRGSFKGLDTARQVRGGFNV